MAPCSAFVATCQRRRDSIMDSSTHSWRQHGIAKLRRASLGGVIIDCLPLRLFFCSNGNNIISSTEVPPIPLVERDQCDSTAYLCFQTSDEIQLKRSIVQELWTQSMGIVSLPLLAVHGVNMRTYLTAGPVVKTRYITADHNIRL